MPKPFDATMRELIELETAAWLRFLHLLPAERVRVIGSNLSTVTAEVAPKSTTGFAMIF
jgi:hypothetical protein